MNETTQKSAGQVYAQTWHAAMADKRNWSLGEQERIEIANELAAQAVITHALAKKDAEIERLETELMQTQGTSIVRAKRDDAELTRLRTLLDEAEKMLVRHHDWHLQQGIQDETLNGLNMGAEYADSQMYLDTFITITKLKTLSTSTNESEVIRHAPEEGNDTYERKVSRKFDPAAGVTDNEVGNQHIKSFAAGVCPECNGYGKVPVNNIQHTEDCEETVYAKCPICNGTVKAVGL